MRIRTLRRIRWALHLVIAVSAGTYIAMEYVRPWAMSRIYAQDYKRLTLQCDQAMHSEVILRAPERSLDVSSQESALLVQSADVELSVCHDYDKLRKRLLVAGLTEDELALLGLEALEIERIPVDRMVEPHRMPRF